MNPDLDLLLKLRDVHPPAAPPWWPPAPGWWLAVGVLALCMWLFARWLPPRVRRWRRLFQLRRAFCDVQRRLDQGHASPQLAAELSALLRRAVLVKTGDAKLAGIHGDAWVALLLAQIPECQSLIAQPTLLTSQPYQAKATPDEVRQLAGIVHTYLYSRTRPLPC